MKTFVLTVSESFPKTHGKAGLTTGFVDSIFSGRKIHTIRSNYDLWAKRIAKVQAGEAILSLRYWSGRPYHTTPIEFLQLGADDGVGIQKLQFNCYWEDAINKPFVDSYIKNIDTLAKNDGLSLDDFKEWFKSYDLTKPMAIIHFTKFRY